MKVSQTRSFIKNLKKLNNCEKAALDKTIKRLIKDPGLGKLKVGDLAGVRVYKFKASTKQYLLAYTFDGNVMTLTLLAIGVHENFYRDLKSN